MSPTSILRMAARQSIHCHPSHPNPPTRCLRLFSQAPLSKYPRKGSEDKDSINTEATEYSKSGTDDAAARQEEAAFDPKTTDPGKEKKVAGEGEVCENNTSSSESGANVKFRHLEIH